MDHLCLRPQQQKVWHMLAQSVAVAVVAAVAFCRGVAHAGTLNPASLDRIFVDFPDTSKSVLLSVEKYDDSIAGAFVPREQSTESWRDALSYRASSVLNTLFLRHTANAQIAGQLAKCRKCRGFVGASGRSWNAEWLQFELDDPSAQLKPVADWQTHMFLRSDTQTYLLIRTWLTPPSAGERQIWSDIMSQIQVCAPKKV